MRQLPESLSPLKNYNQFIVYKLVPNARNPLKNDKVPHSTPIYKCDPIDVKNHLSFDEASKKALSFGENFGVGFVFTENDPFFFIDIDGAYNGAAWSDLANKFCKTFSGCAVEVSQSNTGLHIIGTYKSVTHDHACKNIQLKLEFYTKERFVALTGKSAIGDAGKDCSTLLPTLVNTYFPIKSEAIINVEWTTSPNPQSKPIDDDNVLIEKACKSSTKGDEAALAFGGSVANRTSFKDLWERNIEPLSVVYPDDNGRDFDESSADAALAQHLAFWTGNQCDRIERLMWKSSLVRDKWTKHKSYLQRTINNAVTRQKTFYNKGVDTVIINPVENTKNLEVIFNVSHPFMTIDQMQEYFKNFVYVQENKSILTPDGCFYDREQFKDTFGGYEFQISVDRNKSTNNAWDAFTQNLAARFPKCIGTCFLPKIPSLEIITRDRKTYVNTYVDLQTPSIEGDPSLFLDHVHRLLPNIDDAELLINYMASVVQFKGTKFQWAPVVQGIEGNGKSLLIKILRNAVGDEHTHLPLATELCEKFNEWNFNKIFIGVEEIFVTEEKREVIELLKPMIANDKLACRAMRKGQKDKDSCANWLFLTNYKDAMKMSMKDGDTSRRYCVLYTKHANKAELIKDGMDGHYFKKLHDWLNDENGYAIVNNYFKTKVISDEFFMSLLGPAPDTSSTEEFKALCRGNVEQEILEAIDEGRYGFCEPWVSSFALDRLLEEMRKSNQVPRNKRYDLMRSLGYDYHPGLSKGRVNNAIGGEDNGKPRLYIKDGHILRNVTGGAKIAQLYMESQSNLKAEAAFSQVNTK